MGLEENYVRILMLQRKYLVVPIRLSVQRYIVGESPTTTTILRLILALMDKVIDLIQDTHLILPVG